MLQIYYSTTTVAKDGRMGAGCYKLIYSYKYSSRNSCYIIISSYCVELGTGLSNIDKNVYFHFPGWKNDVVYSVFNSPSLSLCCFLTGWDRPGSESRPTGVVCVLKGAQQFTAIRHCVLGPWGVLCYTRHEIVANRSTTPFFLSVLFSLHATMRPPPCPLDPHGDGRLGPFTPLHLIPPAALHSRRRREKKHVVFFLLPCLSPSPHTASLSHRAGEKAML